MLSIELLKAQIDIPDNKHISIEDYNTDTDSRYDQPGIFINFGAPSDPDLAIFLSDQMAKGLVKVLIEDMPRLSEAGIELIFLRAQDRLNATKAELRERARALDPGPLPI